MSKLLVRCALALALGAGPAVAADQFINVLTGGTSGVYYPLGVALANAIGKAMPQRQDVGPGDQGLGREPQSAAGRPRRDRLHARRFAVRRLEGQRGRRIQDAAEEAARHRGDLSELHPDRRARRLGHQDARRSQGQERFGRRAEIGHRAQRAGDLRRGRHVVQGLLQGRVSAVRRERRADEEPAARRHAAVGGPRRVGAARSRDIGRHRRRADSGGRRQEDQRSGLSAGDRFRPTPIAARPPTFPRRRCRTTWSRTTASATTSSTA